MNKAEFDKFADEYYALHKKNIRSFGEPPEYFAEYKIKDIFRLYKGQNKLPNNILDFGTGIGNSIPYFYKFFPNASLTCLDVSEKCLDLGRRRFNGIANFEHFNGIHIPYANNTFDLIFAACVFHHIPHSNHLQLLQEWFRVLEPGGIGIIYEHNPLNPFTVHAVNSCPFDANAKLIKGSEVKEAMKSIGFKNVNLHYRLFVPGSLRILRPIENYLHKFPLGAQYLVYGYKTELN